MKTLAVPVLLISLMGTPASAQNILTEADDGSVSVIVDGNSYVVSEQIVQMINDVVTWYSDDPDALQQAIREIIVAHASDRTSTALATAITIVATSKVTANSRLLTAIALGATKGNPAISGGLLIASIPMLRSEPGPAEVIEQDIAFSQATVENAHQVSPTGLQ